MKKLVNTLKFNVFVNDVEYPVYIDIDTFRKAYNRVTWLEDTYFFLAFLSILFFLYLVFK